MLVEYLMLVLYLVFVHLLFCTGAAFDSDFQTDSARWIPVNLRVQSSMSHACLLDLRRVQVVSGPRLPFPFLRQRLHFN